MDRVGAREGLEKEWVVLREEGGGRREGGAATLAVHGGPGRRCSSIDWQTNQNELQSQEQCDLSRDHVDPVPLFHDSLFRNRPSHLGAVPQSKRKKNIAGRLPNAARRLKGNRRLLKVTNGGWRGSNGSFTVTRVVPRGGP